MKFLYFSLMSLSLFTTSSFAAPHFKGQVVCSNQMVANSPHSPEKILLLHRLEGGQTVWYYTAGKSSFLSSTFVFSKFEKFDIEAMKSKESKTSAYQDDEEIYAFHLPEYHASVVTYFECEEFTTLDALKHQANWSPSELAALRLKLERF